jgi:hypothetical protein
MVNCNNGSSGFQVMALQISETKFRVSDYIITKTLELRIQTTIRHIYFTLLLANISIDYTRTNIIIFPTYGGHCTVFVNMAKQEAVVK